MDILLNEVGLPEVCGSVLVGLGSVIFPHTFSIILFLRICLHTVFQIEVFRQSRPYKPSPFLSFASHGNGEMKSEVMLSSSENTIDANSIFAEVACDIEPCTVISIEKSSSLKLYLQLRVALVVIGFSHEVQFSRVPRESESILVGVVGLKCIACM